MAVKNQVTGQRVSRGQPSPGLESKSEPETSLQEPPWLTAAVAVGQVLMRPGAEKETAYPRGAVSPVTLPGGSGWGHKGKERQRSRRAQHS